jgi:hypothetical protein
MKNALASGGILILTVLLSWNSILESAASLTDHDDVLLADGLRRTTKFVDATVAEVASDYGVTPASWNADPAIADRLNNNHSPFNARDRGLRGYNDCDRWWNLLFDGWNAHYDLEIALKSDQDAERLLRDTRQRWERQGFDVTESHDSQDWDATRLTVDAGYATFSLYLEREQWRARIGGTTRCLPPA